MEDTYSSARRVVVWLGEETREVEGAFSMIEKAAPEAGSRARPRHFFSGDWSPVFALLRRPWFQRTWIIQEAVLAARGPVLVCGFETLSWEALSRCCGTDEFQEISTSGNDPALAQAMRAIDMIDQARHEQHTKYVTTSYRSLGKTRRKKPKYTPDYRPVSTLYATRGFQCKDQPDKVFGVLNLVTDVGPDDEMLRASYAARVEQVFLAVAQWDITKNQSLELLSYCSRKTERHHPNLPSWVADFSDMDDAESILFLWQQSVPRSLRRRSRIANPRRPPNPWFENGCRPFFVQEDDKTVLVVRGRLVDALAEVGSVTESPKMVIYGGGGGSNSGLPELDMAAMAKRREWLSECVRIALAADPIFT
jgi:hypothetical protein